MSLDKASYKAAIKDAFLEAKAETDPLNFDQAMDNLATALSNAGDTFVKSGTVSVTVTVTTPDTINGGGSGTGSVT